MSELIPQNETIVHFLLVTDDLSIFSHLEGSHTMEFK